MILDSIKEVPSQLLDAIFNFFYFQVNMYDIISHIPWDIHHCKKNFIRAVGKNPLSSQISAISWENSISFISKDNIPTDIKGQYFNNNLRKDDKNNLNTLVEP
ncbi:hypothetical protein AVEN_260467-1 [Araneus ventricosus]|uniref:Uncharacterized protein n=1 Tax=Araneus ventricosus TaxID=182803 RepID=A0A4Y2TUQ3_ARAVE|nr:hypothetical protein AVEN_260467-1 [Araneus ventricosus]